VRQQAVPVEITTNGTVEPLRTVAIQAQVGGLLTEVAFREGQEVAEGQVLFRIDPRPFQAALAQAEAVLARDQAQAANAVQNAQRLAELAQKDYVTTAQYEDAKAAAAALAASVAADQAAVETARLNLQYATIRAPISGRAGALLVRAGNIVKPNAETLVVINQLRPILVRFPIAASDLGRIRSAGAGTMVVRVRPGADTTGERSGTLSFIDNAVDSATGTILLKGRFENRDAALWPGEFVNVTLQLRVEPNAIVAPAVAVVTGQQGTYVFIVSTDGKAKLRPVTVDRTVGDLAVVSQGLTAGERVVIDGQIRLTDGSAVEVKPAAAAPGGV
jgi:multidrug efflux system membrane fusion protein